MLTRTEALQLINDTVKNPNMIRHMLAVEAVMRSLARRLDEDVELWGITGLIHDLDAEETLEEFQRHTYIASERLGDVFPPEVWHAIHCHPGHILCETRLDWGLYCADPVTGLITAATLMHPSRRLPELPLKSLQKRFKEKRFAAGANREGIQSCEKIGLELEEFLELSLKAMQGIADQLGLE